MSTRPSKDDLDLLDLEFYEKSPHELARALLGKLLVRQTESDLLVARLVELEVYGGVEDPASHSNSGVPTERTRTMFGEPGSVYIYRSYGIHLCLNIVAPKDTHASAILVRAAEPVRGIDVMAEARGRELSDEPTQSELRSLMSGPGKLCEALDIEMRLNGESLDGLELAIADADEVDDGRIATTPRVGLNPKTCGDSVNWRWRYVVADSPHLSRKVDQ